MTCLPWISLTLTIAKYNSSCLLFFLNPMFPEVWNFVNHFVVPSNIWLEQCFVHSESSMKLLWQIKKSINAFLPKLFPNFLHMFLAPLSWKSQSDQFQAPEDMKYLGRFNPLVVEYCWRGQAKGKAIADMITKRMRKSRYRN